MRLIDLLELNVRYELCVGAELFTCDGRQIVDFLSGYCVHNVGHNHPDVVRALQRELERRGPAMIQSHVADLAGELAEQLCTRAGGRLQKAFFCSSGSEGVEAAIKFAGARTRREGIRAAEHEFDGLTCGALSLMSDKFWSGGFGPLLPGTKFVPFGDVAALQAGSPENFLRSVRRDSSGDVWADCGDAPVSRFWISHPSVRESFHGVESRAAAGDRERADECFLWRRSGAWSNWRILRRVSGPKPWGWRADGPFGN